MRTAYSLVVALAILMAPSFQQQEAVEAFPQGVVERDMVAARNNFNRVYGDYAQILSIKNLGAVENPQETVDEMMKTGVLLKTGNSEEVPSVEPLALSALTDGERSLTRDSLLLNVDRGDFKIEISMRNQKSGSTYTSVNSMSKDGNRFSGIFLGTTRLPGDLTTSMRLPNTVCQTKIVTTYLWGAPAETVKACVRATCEENRCVDCVVTDTSAYGGLFGGAKILPNAGTSGRSPSPDCCEAYFKYSWVTGFKSVKVNVEKFGFEIHGRLGQSGNGSFTVRECCGPVRLH